jgi:hypothetical protein
LALREDVDGVLSVTPFCQEIGYALMERADAAGPYLTRRFSPSPESEFQADGKHCGTVAWYRTEALRTLPPGANIYALRLAPYWVPFAEGIDVNTEVDLWLAEALLARQ